MKRLVVSALRNRIYYANIKKDGTIGVREDITEQAIALVFQHLSNNIADNKKELEIRYESKEGYVLKMIKE